MVESQFWNELTAETVANVEARTRVIDAQEHLTEVLIERLGSSPFHENLIKQIDDLERLRRMRRVQLTANSWDAVTSIE